MYSFRVENDDNNAIVPIYLILHVANWPQAPRLCILSPNRTHGLVWGLETTGRSYPCFEDGTFLDCCLVERIELSFLFFF
jgi:hypothetical protein